MRVNEDKCANSNSKTPLFQLFVFTFLIFPSQFFALVRWLLAHYLNIYLFSLYYIYFFNKNHKKQIYFE